MCVCISVCVCASEGGHILSCFTSPIASTALSSPPFRAPQYEPKIGRLGSIAGLIARERLPGFERLLFRATRGNNYFRSMSVGKVMDPATGEDWQGGGKGTRKVEGGRVYVKGTRETRRKCGVDLHKQRHPVLSTSPPPRVAHVACFHT